jgi:aminoglycoside phosphotransferase (APT) family kinase protein
MTDAFAMARARRALAEAGLDMHLPLTRASSVTNEVWISDEYVVRVNRQPNQRLRREAQLGPSLPAEVGYPTIVAYGGQLGADWLVVRRVRGNPLSRCWPTMTAFQRRAAVSQLAGMLQALHRTRCPAGIPEIDTPQLLGRPRMGLRAADAILVALDRAEQLPHVERSLMADTRRLVLDTGDAIEPFDAPTLVHGDLHFENVLWDGISVTTMLDFEWSRPGPPDLELDVFLRFCAYPYLHVAEDYEHLTRAEDYEPVARWLAEDYPELFAVPGLFERTRIYAIAYDVRELLLFPPPRAPRELSTYHPHNRLERVVRGGSHLHRLAGMNDRVDEPFSVGGTGIYGSASDFTSSPRVPR